MPKINVTEGQTLECKRQWTDRALEDLAAFANTDGGTLLRELQRITSRIASHREYREYRALNNVSDEAAGRDLKRLAERGVFNARGKGRNVRYVLSRYSN